MTTITAKFHVASSDKKNTLPAAVDPKHAMNQPPQATAPELRRIYIPRNPVNREPKRGTLLHYTGPPSRDASTTRPMESTTSSGRSNWM